MHRIGAQKWCLPISVLFGAVYLLLNSFITTDYHPEQLVLNATIKQEYNGARSLDQYEDKHGIATVGQKPDHLYQNEPINITIGINPHQNTSHNKIIDRSYSVNEAQYPHKDVQQLDQLTGRCATIRPRNDEIKYMNTYWQVLHTNETYISVYSAFFYNNVTPAEGSSLYINAVAKQLSHHRREEKVSAIVQSRYHCQVWYDGFFHPVITSMVYVRNEFLRSIDNVTYSTYMLTCHLKFNLIKPTHVSIVRESCDPSTILLTVLDVSLETQQHQFGICTAVGFGALPPQHMVEWFEFQQLLGVGEINIYDAHMRGLKKVFRHYQDINVLVKTWITSPIPSHHMASLRLASQVVLNDCMMKNRNRYRYLVIVDFDEIMWPSVRANFSSLLQTINRVQNVSRPWQSYTFQNTYHMLNFPEDHKQPAYLRTMRFRHRKPPTTFPLKSKSIIDPKMCIIVFHHACVMSMYPTLDKTIAVDPSIAMSHHYRECPKDAADCDIISSHSDDGILQYKSELNKRVHTILSKLGLL